MRLDGDVAEVFPRLYRRILDAVGALDTLGARRQAARLRESAIRTYSGRWDERGVRRLEETLARAEAALEQERQSSLRIA